MFKNLFSKNKDNEIDKIVPETEPDLEKVLIENPIDKKIEITETNIISENKELKALEPDMMIKENKAEMMYRLALKEFKNLLFDNPNFNPSPFTDDMSKNDYATYLKVTNLVKQVAKTDLNLASDLFEVMKEAVKTGTLSDALTEGKKLLEEKINGKSI